MRFERDSLQGGHDGGERGLAAATGKFVDFTLFGVTFSAASPEAIKMTEWSVQEAKSKFSALLEACLAEGPQIVTKRGVEVAVLAPLAEWRRLNAEAKPSLKSMLLSDAARSDELVCSRGGLGRRAPAVG